MHHHLRLAHHAAGAPGPPAHAGGSFMDQTGLSRPMFAFVFGTVSGLSLPIGAWLGIKLAPVSDQVVAGTMAFGAGSLLFAVTVELYGHALHELHRGHIGQAEIFTEILGALIGASMYLAINGFLANYFGSKEEQEAPGHGQAPVSRESPGAGRVMHTLQEMREGSAARRMLEEIEKKEGGAASAEVGESQRAAQDRWKKVRHAAKMVTVMRKMKKNNITSGHILLQASVSETELFKNLDAEAAGRRAWIVALQIFVGLLVDGVPEGILLGFLAAEHNLSPVLIIALFIANFPESFSSASLMTQARAGTCKILGFWLGLCTVVGALAGLSCWGLLALYPNYGHGHSVLPMGVLLGIALIEGVTGGAMLACISSVMLPEAFERMDQDGPVLASSGFLCTCGFLMAVLVKVIGG